MIAAWMLYAVAVAAALSLAAWAAERIARLAGYPGRWVWAVAMAGTLVLPVVVPLWSTRPAPEPVAAAEVPVMPAPPSAPSATSAPLPAATPAPRADWRGIVEGSLGWGWAALSATGLGLLGFSALSLRRLRRRWRPDRVAGEPVLLSARTGPAVVGCFRSDIVLPEWVLEWGEEEQRLIVRHEAEHARARDPLLMLGGCLAVAATPWNLPLWWQLSRLRLAVELDCDRRVLGSRGDPRSYGMLLLAVGRRASTGWLPATAFSEPRSLLERRIRSITARRPRRWKLQAAALAAVVCAVPLAVHASPSVAPPATERLAAWLLPGAGHETVQDGPVLWITPDYRAGAHDGRLIAEEAIGDWLEDARGDRGATTLRVNVVTDAPGSGYSAIMARRAACETGFERLLLSRAVARPGAPPAVQPMGEEMLGAGCGTTVSIPWIEPPSAGPEGPATADSVADGTGGWAYRVGALDAAPRLVDAAAARAIAERLRPERFTPSDAGEMAALRFVVERDGRVDGASVRVSGTAAADAARVAPALVERLRFEPGRYHGRAVRTLILMPIQWSNLATTNAQDTALTVARAYPAPARAGESPRTVVVDAVAYPAPRGAQGNTASMVVDAVTTARPAVARPVQQGPTYELSVLSRPPRLANQATIATVMERLYPRLLQDAGIGGTVVAQFVIREDGIVDSSTVRIIDSPNEMLSDVTLRAIEAFRFQPGQYEGRNVRVLIQMPVTWQPADRPAAGATSDFSGIPPTPGQAQSAPLVIAGVVIDERTRRPLTGVSVVIPALTRGTVTGVDGRFVLGNLPAGRHRLVVTIPATLGNVEASVRMDSSPRPPEGTTVTVEIVGPSN